jgi:hypothetical protein
MAFTIFPLQRKNFILEVSHIFILILNTNIFLKNILIENLKLLTIDLYV